MPKINKIKNENKSLYDGGIKSALHMGIGHAYILAVTFLLSRVLSLIRYVFFQHTFCREEYNVWV